MTTTTTTTRVADVVVVVVKPVECNSTRLVAMVVMTELLSNSMIPYPLVVLVVVVVVVVDMVAVVVPDDQIDIVVVVVAVMDDDHADDHDVEKLGIVYDHGAVSLLLRKLARMNAVMMVMVVMMVW